MTNCEWVRLRKARKQHKCCECYKTIQVGEHYEFSSGIWEGCPESHKTCGYCANLRSLACKLAKKLDYEYEHYPAYSLLSEFMWQFKFDNGIPMEQAS